MLVPPNTSSTGFASDGTAAAAAGGCEAARSLTFGTAGADAARGGGGGGGTCELPWLPAFFEAAFFGAAFFLAAFFGAAFLAVFLATFFLDVFLGAAFLEDFFVVDFLFDAVFLADVFFDAVLRATRLGAVLVRFEGDVFAAFLLAFFLPPRRVLAMALSCVSTRGNLGRTPLPTSRHPIARIGS